MKNINVDKNRDERPFTPIMSSVKYVVPCVKKLIA